MADRETNDTVTQGIVLYTDGSARPNPGFTGYGVHGYKYRNEPSKRGLGLQKVEATASGYSMGITQSDKKLPSVTVLEYYDMLGSDRNSNTNNGAEIDALIQALKTLDLSDTQHLTVYTDSDYLRRGLIEWVPIWSSKHWRRADGTTINNCDKWMTLSYLVDNIKAKGVDFQIYWVKGHNGDIGNSIADKLAVIGTMHSCNGLYKNYCTISEPTGYWKNTAVKDPLIGFKRLYFNSSADYNKPGHYYLVEPGGDEKQIGGRLPEASYCVLRLKNPDSVIETIRDYQHIVSNDINSIMIMRLDKVYSRDTYKYLAEHGQYALVQNTKGTIGLNFVDNEPVTLERNPAGLSLRAIEIYGFLDEILNKYTNGTLGDQKYLGFKLHDITHLFFDQKPLKTTLPKWFPKKIIAGGQTGADRAGLDWAIQSNIPHGGWCPKGRIAEDGTLSDIYKLKETASKNYMVRTEKNIKDSDATLIINTGILTSGTLRTFNYCSENNKPVLVVNIDEPSSRITEWLQQGRYKTLNIAGPRESKCPGIYEHTLRMLSEIIPSISSSTQTLLKPEHVVGTTDIRTHALIQIPDRNDKPIELTIPIMLGLDLPSRNQLKRLEEMNPRIELLTWIETDQCVRYSCIITTDNGVGIWSNFFADRIYIP